MSSATTGFALNGLDGNGKPKFLTEIPHEHVQHIEAMLPSESLVANNDNKFQLSSEGMSLNLLLVLWLQAHNYLLICQ